MVKRLTTALLSGIAAYLIIYYLKTRRYKAITDVIILHDVTSEFEKLRGLRK